MIIAKSQTITSWAKMAPLGDDFAAREGASMASYNGELYILGGNDNAWGGKDFAKYNPITKKLTKLKSFIYTTNPLNQGLFEVGGKLYTYQQSSIYIYNFTSGNWTSVNIGSVGLTQRCGGGFVIGTTIYFIDEGSKMMAFDTLTNTAVIKASRPYSGAGFAAFSIGTKGYMVGVAGHSDNFWEYDSQSDLWIFKGHLPKEISYGIGISLNGKGYVGLGTYVLGTTLTYNLQWYEYNPENNTWTNKSDYSLNNTNRGVRNTSVAKIGNDLYFYGGGSSTSQPYNSFLRSYNTTSDTWTFIDWLGENRFQAAGFYYNDKIYVVGGYDGVGVYRDAIHEYDIQTNQWKKIANTNPYNFLFNSYNAAVLNNKLYQIGGYSPQNVSPGSPFSKQVLCYDLVTNMWSQKSDFPDGERGYVFTCLYDNQLYAFGGSYYGTSRSSSSKYNEQSDTWSYIASAPVGISKDKGWFSVLGDYLYYFGIVPGTSYLNVYRYSFINDNWETVSYQQLSSSGISDTFSNNNKLYFYLDGGEIKEFDTVTNTFKNDEALGNIPFSSTNQLIVSTPDGVYFGFGRRYEYPSAHNSNSWTKLRFGAGVSTETGTYQTGYYDDEIGDENYNPTCGMGGFTTGINRSGSLYDFKGNLFASVHNGYGLCLKVGSRPLSQTYYTHIESNKRKSYLNKSFIVGYNNTPNKLRFYFTSQELQAFVDDFNTIYETTQTINDIKIINISTTYQTNADFDPTNNSSFPTRKSLSYTLQNYGADEYFEIPETTLYEGEIHLYLEKEELSVNDTTKKTISIYPNPVKNIVNINSPEIVTSYEIYSLEGKKLLFEQKDNVSKIDVSKLPTGNYMLKLQTNKGEETFKIIKSN